MRSFRENAGENSLKALHIKVRCPSTASRPAKINQLRQWLQAKNMSFKAAERADGSILLAGKIGSLQKLGYFLAHAAIVLICIGGLMDGNVLLKMQQVLGNKR